MFLCDGRVYLRRNDRRCLSAPEGEVIWMSATHFQVHIKHWIIDALVDVRGQFRQGDSILSLEIIGDGMTGLEDYSVDLQKDNPNMLKFQRPSESPSYRYQIPISEGDEFFPAADASQEGVPILHIEETVQNIKIQSPASHVDPRIEGLLILKNGKVIVEEYFWGMDKGVMHMISSCTKSITAILVGIAIDLGLATLDDVISDAFNDSSEWGQGEPIRLCHVLAMVSGTEFDGQDSYGAGSQALLETDNVVKYMLSTPRTSMPGEKYHYNNGLPAILGPFLERKSGMSVEVFARKYLFQPLGITRYRWTRMREKSVDGTQSVLTAGGLYMTLRDMAKVGQMMLDDGVYRGRRIISSEYVRKSTQQHTAEGQWPYGFYWHLINNSRRHLQTVDGYTALGQGEQIITVVPSLNLVIVAVSSSWFYGNTYGRLGRFAIFDSLDETLVRRLSV